MLRQLLDEIHLLMGSFPDLRDAFDDDDLPIAFILERDSPLAGAGAKPPQALSPTAKTSSRRRTMSPRTRSRGGPRKQISGE
jgi:hypothetical protein